MSKTVFQVSKEYGARLDEFRSPLSREWETILFKAIDVLHQLDREKICNGRTIVNALLPMVKRGQYDDAALGTAIDGVQELLNGREVVFLTARLTEVMGLLTAVRTSMSK